MNVGLPEGWTEIRVGDYFTSWGGMTPSTSNASYWGGDVPWVSSKDIKTWRITDGSEFITQKALEETRLRLCSAGSVLVVVRSGILAHTLPVAVADAPVSINQDIKAFHCADAALNEWLAVTLRSLAPEILAHNRKDGTTVQSIRYEELCDLRVPVPPSEEQRRISARLQELLQKVEGTRQHLSQVPAILKRFRQAVLAAACSGRLTEDWRAVKPQTTQWRDCLIEDVADFIGGFAYKSPTFAPTGKHRVIRIGNVRPFALDFSASPVFISDKIAEQTDRFRLCTDDVVISMTGTKFKRDYGFAAIFDGTSDFSVFLNQRVGRLRAKQCILPLFLLYVLQTDHFRDFFFKGETGNVNQGNVGSDGIKKAPISLPPMAEQHEIVRRVHDLLRLANAIEQHLDVAIVRGNKLTQSTLAKAFRGELVPTEAELARREGREYEPASVLLERIKKEREMQPVRKADGKRTGSRGKFALAKA